MGYQAYSRFYDKSKFDMVVQFPQVLLAARTPLV